MYGHRSCAFFDISMHSNSRGADGKSCCNKPLRQDIVVRRPSSFPCSMHVHVPARQLEFIGHSSIIWYHNYSSACQGTHWLMQYSSVQSHAERSHARGCLRPNLKSKWEEQT